MANFLADLGMAMPAITQMQAVNAETKQREQAAVMQNFQIDQYKKEQERLDKPIPLENFQAKFADNSEGGKTFIDMMRANGFVNNAGGIETVNQRGIKTTQQAIGEDQELHSQMAQWEYRSSLQKQMGLQQQIAEAQAKGNSKLVETLTPQLQSAKQRVDQMLEMNKKMAAGKPEVAEKVEVARAGAENKLQTHMPTILEDKNTHVPKPWYPQLGQEPPQNAVIPATARQQDPQEKPGSGDKAKAPLPTATGPDGIVRTISSEGPINYANWVDAQGVQHKEPLDPKKHGTVTAASESQKDAAMDADLEGAVKYNVEMAKRGEPIDMKGMGGVRANLAVRNALQKEIDKGLDAGDLAGVKRIKDSLTKSLNTQETSFNNLQSYVLNLDKQIDRFSKPGGVADQLFRLDAKLENEPIYKWNTMIAGKPYENIAKMYVNEISSECAKIANGAQSSVQAPSDTMAAKWDQVHDLKLNMTDLRTVMGETKELGNIRLSSSKEIRDQTRGFINTIHVGGGATSAPVAAKTQGPDATKMPVGTVKVIAGTKYKKGDD